MEQISLQRALGQEMASPFRCLSGFHIGRENCDSDGFLEVSQEKSAQSCVGGLLCTSLRTWLTKPEPVFLSHLGQGQRSPAETHETVLTVLSLAPAGKAAECPVSVLRGW